MDWPFCLVMVKRHTETTYNMLHRHVFRKNVMVTIPFPSLTVGEMGCHMEHHLALIW